jgi:3-hydroxyisobutyrate dehydrogenase-like beta-hydroxyacid dehydrogenase
MATLAFCGLGVMGLPMAVRLAAAGHRVRVWNRTPGRDADALAAGAVAAATPAEAARDADAAITMLSGPEALAEVALSPDGVAAALAPGGALIEMSTVGPDAVRTLAERLAGRVAVLDAPVTGSAPQAAAGTLRIMVGATAEEFARWREVLAAMGEPVHVGPPGTGAALKLVVNAATAALTALLAEALVLGDRLGVDQAVALDALAASPMGIIVERTRDKIERGSYPPAFKLALAAKDLGLADRLAAEGGLELRLAGAARSRLQAAERDGLGELDFSAVVAHLRGAPAQEPRRDP